MLSPKLIIPFALVLMLTECNLLSKSKLEAKSNSNRIVDDPLFLTKYIEKNDLETARLLSRCGDLPNAPPLESYSGFITVRKEYNSNIFFWFFPSVNKDPEAPVILWLQGGPGQSCLLGLFVEHGPYVIQANLTAVLREHHWAQTFSMIYVDNPVGAGYSFTKDERGYVTNQIEMADDMYEFLRQFFILFYEFKNNDFYIAGESYGGKYVPSLAHKIHSMETSAVVQLTGIMIGNGLCDPETMLKYSEHMYNIGLIDEKQAKYIKKLEDGIVENIKKGENYKADLRWRKLLYSYHIITGMEFSYNFLLSETPEDFFYYLDYIELPQFRRALRLGKRLHVKNSNNVRSYMVLDFVNSAKPNVTVIMDNYRVLIYHGQLDIIIPYPSIASFLKTVNWKYAEEYKTAERKIWHLKNSIKIAGYVHNVGDFYEVMVRNAGHEVAYDQPEFAFDLISRFINKEPY